MSARVVAFGKPAPRITLDHVVDLSQIATLACKECGKVWTAPNPVALYQKGVRAVEQWHCPYCHGAQLSLVQGSERAAPPRR